MRARSMSDFDFDRDRLDNIKASDWPRYVGSTDKKGHGDSIRTQHPPETASQLKALVASGAIADYHHVQDAIRVYVVWGMKIDAILLKDTNPVMANELMMTARRVERQLRVQTEYRYLEEDQDTAAQMRSIIKHQPNI